MWRLAPDGTTLVSGSDDNTIRLWAVKTGELKRVLTGHGHDVSVVAFSPDSTTVASGSEDRTVRLWDTETGEQKQVVTGYQGFCQKCRVQPRRA